MSHFTYDNSDQLQLRQGDILEKTDDIKIILDKVHPRYLRDDYKFFFVLTQSCDLERRNGNPCKARYITLAAIRPLSLLIEREIQRYKKHPLEKRTNLLDVSNKGRLQQFLERLINNNEPEYFYLHEDVGLGFSESYVAFLRLSIAVKAINHYDVCLKAKKAGLRNDFKAKLGWLVGNIYSRVGTEDWLPNNITKENYKKMIQNIVDKNCIWGKVKEFIKEFSKAYPKQKVEDINENELEKLLKELKIPSKKKLTLDRLKIILSQSKYISNEDDVDKIIMRISNDPEISAILQ